MGLCHGQPRCAGAARRDRGGGCAAAARVQRAEPCHHGVGLCHGQPRCAGAARDAIAAAAVSRLRDFNAQGLANTTWALVSHGQPRCAGAARRNRGGGGGGGDGGGDGEERWRRRRRRRQWRLSMAGGGGDGDGRGGEGVDVVGVVVGGLGGGVAASAATASAGWRRGDSARGRIPAAGGADPLPRPRHEESNLEPRQLGAAGADHHRGRSAQPPCQAAPHHGQPVAA